MPRINPERQAALEQVGATSYVEEFGLVADTPRTSTMIAFPAS
jgi:hypothetical protein